MTEIAVIGAASIDIARASVREETTVTRPRGDTRLIVIRGIVEGIVSGESCISIYVCATLLINDTQFYQRSFTINEEFSTRHAHEVYVQRLDTRQGISKKLQVNK